ncbi:MAG: hypothetical protein ABW321_32535, partial [Polyangiales bacterium]
MSERNLSREPALALGSIQSDLLLNHSKKAEALVFFTITDPAKFKQFVRGLPITSAAAVYRPVGEELAVATGELPPNPRFGAAFTHAGLRALRVASLETLTAAESALPFVQGLAERAVTELNDSDPRSWVVGRPKEDLHGVFIVTGAEEADVDAGLRLHFHFATHIFHGYHVLETLRGNTRPGADEGREHFGFLDGISQPGIRGCVDAAQTKELTVTHPDAEPTQGLPGQDLLWPGEFVFGYPAQDRERRPDGSFPPFEEKGPVKTPPLPFMVNGAYLVVRRLRQLVPEMHAGTRREAQRVGLSPELVEAQLVGRWPSGAPILERPTADDPVLGADPVRNNDFEFEGDRLGLVCPWAAHIRKTYPRDDVPGNTTPVVNPDGSSPEVDSAEGFTQTHRMLRRGIQFGPEVTDAEERAKRTLEQRGLLFKCYVTDIADQFEFVQKQWANNPMFAQPRTGIDAIIGQVPGGDVRELLGAASVAGDPSSKPTFKFQPWVEMTGGG